MLLNCLKLTKDIVSSTIDSIMLKGDLETGEVGVGVTIWVPLPVKVNFVLVGAATAAAIATAAEKF